MTGPKSKRVRCTSEPDAGQNMKVKEQVDRPFFKVQEFKTRGFSWDNLMLRA